MSRRSLLAALTAICASLGAGLGLLDRVPSHLESTEVVSDPPTASTSIQVHVAGWVSSPGVVTLPEGAIVADAIEASGGLLPGAATGSLNLAARVVDADQVIVPGPGIEAPGAEGEARVVINRATVGELEGLPGLGPVLAQRIVDYRDQNGPFREVEDLLDVPGIGESKLSSLRDLIRVP